FANDAWFEQNRYKQQKKTNNASQHQPRYHHRHTQSTQSAITATARRKKASHIRHYSHVSCISASNITVNSEDLTAKEFADIAGIRILSEDDDHDFEHDNEDSLMRRKIYEYDASSLFEQQEPQIWDQDFWQRPGGGEEGATLPTTSSNSIVEPPPILHELKRNSQYNMAVNQDTFIKKGRFEIHLNSARSSNVIESIAAAPKIQRPDAVVEWKRK
ncbi:hypothetical protein FB192DRAFT_1260127, partial [Mucor lusitanicus]